MIKNAFYFTLKNGLIRKKSMMSHLVQKTIAIHIMINISRSKDNQTITFGQLIECNMRNIFLEKSYTQCGGETTPRSFSKKSEFSISLDQ